MESGRAHIPFEPALNDNRILKPVEEQGPLYVARGVTSDKQAISYFTVGGGRARRGSSSAGCPAIRTCALRGILV